MDAPPSRPRVGISACLLGHPVRHTGNHSHDAALTTTFAPHVEWVPVCPEVEVGMGTPRESVHLEASDGAPRLVAPRSGIDWTDDMVRYAHARIAGLRALGLHGYILKKSSPTCGMAHVRVHWPDATDPNHRVKNIGRGVFADALLRLWPELPVEEEGRLRNLRLREHFVERVFAYHRWCAFLDGSPGPGELVAFHAAHRLTLHAHSPALAKRLGRTVAEAGRGAFEARLSEYGAWFAECLRAPATMARHGEVLARLYGRIKGALPPEERREFVELIEGFRRGRIPLAVPLTLLRHHLRTRPDAWVLAQTYLAPYPEALRLRSALLEPRASHLGG